MFLFLLKTNIYTFQNFISIEYWITFVKKNQKRLL